MWIYLHLKKKQKANNVSCYNIMYVLYHSDAEKFLQYCEKIKEDCDNMSRHRIDVLIEEIVKK